MTPLTRAKLAVGAVGLLVWGYGARMEDERFQWTGVAILAIAFLLRFLNPRDRE